MGKRLAAFAIAALTCASGPARGGEFGELRLVFGTDGRRETIEPGRLVGVERRTPRKRPPMMVASWRQESGAAGTPSFRTTLVQFSASEADATDLTMSFLFEGDGMVRHYAVKCSATVRPRCDPTRHGLSHDASGQRVRLKDVVFRRVTLKDALPDDAITVSGELRYSR